MDYGYGVWLHDGDPVDDDAVTFSGSGAQCVIHSKEHETIIVSMGGGAVRRPTCQPVWEESRRHIIPHRADANATRLLRRPDTTGREADATVLRDAAMRQ